MTRRMQRLASPRAAGRRRLVVVLALWATGAPLAGSAWAQRSAAMEQLLIGGRAAVESFRELAADPEGVSQAVAELASGAHVADPGARRRLALLIERAGESDAIPSVALLLDDPDLEVRRTLLAWLVRPDHRERHLEDRIAALSRLAEADPLSNLRRRALTALGEFDDQRAVVALADLALRLPAPDRGRAAAALRPIPAARDTVRRLVRAGFEPAPGQQRTPDDVLGEVLRLHGRLLADEAGGGEVARDRAVLVQGLRHPARIVRRGAEAAFQQLLGRLQAAGEVQRAEHILGLLAAEGLDARAIYYQQARLALADAGDPSGARRAARALLRTPGGSAHETLFERTLWTFRALYLEALAEFADGRGERALALLGRAGATLDVVLRERLDLQTNDEARLDHVDALHQRGLTHLAEILVRLSLDRTGQDARWVEVARRAHRLTLEAQRGYVRVVGETLATWDNLLDHDISPLRICFTLRDLPGLSTSEGLDLQKRFGRVLASVAPREMPGFEPWPGQTSEVADPLTDPRRRGRAGGDLRGRPGAGRGGARRAASALHPAPNRRPRAFGRTARGARAAAGAAHAGAADGDLGQLGSGAREALGPAHPLFLGSLGQPRPARRGRATEARSIGQRMRDDVEANPSHARFFWGLQMLARIEMAIGSSFTDEGEGERAEEELLKAVDRLEGIEQRLTELEASRRQIATIEALRSTALVSLAVNANVKLRDPARALEYYEQAYELRQDDFMRVLLACYRARMDRGDEARALLREIHPHPDLYYNLACTYALLGDTETALDYLEKELEENLASESARQRQREWASEDPDLESLVGDPRFERLVERD